MNSVIVLLTLSLPLSSVPPKAPTTPPTPQTQIVILGTYGTTPK